MEGNITVIPYAATKNPLQDAYQNWTSGQTTSLALVTPFGQASARHSRGVPFAQTNATDYGGSAVGDSYQQMIFGLRGQSTDTSKDSDLAEALLTLSSVKLKSQVQKNAAAKLTVSVYLAEQWRKQGADKIWRALLRLVKAKKINLDKARALFKYIESADAGRRQAARFQDVHEGAMDLGDLSKDEQMIYGAMSPIREDDFSSDDELRDEKELKTVNRLFADKYQEESEEEES